MDFKSNTMNLNFSGDVGYLTFKNLEKYSFLRHAYSTRLGGVSKNEFKSMNLSFSCGDDAESVMKNYEIFCNALNFDMNKIVRTKQVHENEIEIISEKDVMGKEFEQEVSETADGLITNVPGIILSTRHADCLAIFMFDPVLKVIGLAHAGWRGTVAKIAKSLFDAFVNHYGSDPQNIVCALGPGIGQCCFEVDENTFEEFKSMNLPNFNSFYIQNGNKFNIDTLKVNKQLLIDCGIKKQNIFGSDVCTNCNHELLFSHRASGGRRGNNAAFIMIKN